MRTRRVAVAPLRPTAARANERFHALPGSMRRVESREKSARPSRVTSTEPHTNDDIDPWIRARPLRRDAVRSRPTHGRCIAVASAACDQLLQRPRVRPGLRRSGQHARRTRGPGPHRDRLRRNLGRCVGIRARLRRGPRGSRTGARRSGSGAVGDDGESDSCVRLERGQRDLDRGRDRFRRSMAQRGVRLLDRQQRRSGRRLVRSGRRGSRGHDVRGRA